MTEPREPLAGQNPAPQGVDDEELIKVIADFLEMGHVDNIIAMFRQEERYYDWVGRLLTDERFSVRLGVSVLMESMTAERPRQVVRAIPALAAMLDHEDPLVRGEALSVLAIIGGEEALRYIRRKQDDPSPQVREVISDILDSHGNA